MMYKLEVGQKVFVFGAYRSKELVSAIIKTVGRKYFTVFEFPGDRFKLDNLHLDSEYITSIRVYLSEQDYKDEIEIVALAKNIYAVVNYQTRIEKFGLDKLRRIKAILDEAEGE